MANEDTISNIPTDKSVSGAMPPVTDFSVAKNEATPASQQQQIPPKPEAVSATKEIPTTQTEQPSTETPSKDVPKPPAQQGGEITLNRVNTYQDAVKEALRSQTMSTASILMAEQKRRQNTEAIAENQSIKNPRNIIFMVIAGVLVAAGLLTVGFVFLSKNGSMPFSDSRGTITATFFEPDGSIDITAAQLSRNTILKIQQVISGPIQRGTVQRLIVTKEVLQNNDSAFITTENVAYSTDDLLSLIGARVPTNFNQSVDQTFFFGVHATQVNTPFLIFKIRNFDNVFSSMFAWESTLARDMQPIFRELNQIINPTPPLQAPQPVATTTETNGAQPNEALGEDEETPTTIQNISEENEDQSTPIVVPTPQRTTATRTFTDEVIANSDSRVARNLNGEVIFFYTFVDEEYLVMTTRQQTLNEIKKRIRSAKLIL